jgi:hypothetical protein
MRTIEKRLLNTAIKLFYDYENFYTHHEYSFEPFSTPSVTHAFFGLSCLCIVFDKLAIAFISLASTSFTSYLS